MDQFNRKSFNEFYKRQISCLGPALQERLRHITIAVVGLGGLGSHSLMTLAPYGIGKVKLIDGDKVAQHNLHRQPIYRVDDEGKKKSECAALFFSERNQYTEFEPYGEYLSQENIAAIIGQCDIIVDGTDSIECTRLLNQYSCENGVPLIAASVESRNGYVGVFNGGYKSSACHDCLFPDFPEHVPTCSEIGVDPLAVSLTANIQAQLVIKALLQEEEIKSAVFQINKGPRVIEVELEKDENCSTCSSFVKETEKAEVINFDVVSDLGGSLLIDVREENEFSDNPRSNASNIPMSNILDDPKTVPNQDVTLCCATGLRSERVARFLKETGFKNNITLLDQRIQDERKRA